MEGLISYFPFWAGYCLAAFAGLWCWDNLFFWLPRHSDLRRFFHMLGAVLLFTPAPIAQDSGYFAPAFVVIPFTTLGSSFADAMYALNWLLGGLCVGIIVLALRHLIYVLKQNTENEG